MPEEQVSTVDDRYLEILELAGHALRRESGTEIALTFDGVMVDYPGAAAVLVRARVATPSPPMPSTVVIKKSSMPGVVALEAAGLDFVAQCAGIEGLAPRRLAADPGQRLLVMADLAGPDTSRVGDLLFNRDYDRAADVLAAAQTALGRLHSAGIGQRDTYQRILARYGTARTSRHAVNHLASRLRNLPTVLADQVDGVATAAVEREVRSVDAELFRPGPFTTLTHGDPTVGNLLYSPVTGINFVDFETAGYRHALIDGCFARLRYLYSVWAHQIPRAVQRRLLQAYRAELVKGCPPAEDDEHFAHALLCASAAWLAALCAHRDRVADQDVRWGRATYRQRIVAGLEHFVLLADEYDRLPALRDAAQRLGDQLRDSWPAGDRQLCSYPALATG